MIEVIAELNAQTKLCLSNVVADQVSRGPPDPVESDIASLMNLLIPRANYKVDHAQYFPQDPGLINRGRIVLEGGSFSQQLLEIASKAQIFGSVRHFFYYTQHMRSYPDGKIERPVNVKAIDWKSQILDADAIIIEKNAAAGLEDTEQFIDDLLKALESSGKF